MDVFWRDVELIEEVFPHEAMVGVNAGRIHRVVFVEVERDHVGEADPSSWCIRISSRYTPMGVDPVASPNTARFRPRALSGRPPRSAGRPAGQIIGIVHDHCANALEIVRTSDGR